MKYYYKNPRTITEKQIENLRETLPELGDLGGIVHDLNSDEVIGGNQRVRAMGLLGVEPVIVERYDPPNAQGTVSVGYYEVNGEQFKYRAVMWTPRQCEKANVVANKAGGTWDFDTLANDFDMDDLLEWGFDEGELIGWPQEEPAEDPGAQLDKAAELQEKWGVVRGDIWTIESVATPGKFHRVMCGDSTSAEDVGRLMGESVAALCASDPPYNVGVEYGESVDDEKAEAVYASFSAAWFLEWQQVSERQIVTPGCYNLARWCRYFDPYHVAPWTKTNSMTNGKVARWWCWEPVLFYGDGWQRKRANDVFEFPIGQQASVANHPCPKPLKMWADLAESYTEPGDAIADAFLGSGTTLVACEQTGRIGYGMEIEPKYVSVTLERLAGMGLEPQRVTQ